MADGGSVPRPSIRTLFARADTAALPDRVKAIIIAEDRASEHLIGLVQIGLGVTLMTLYLAAPRPSDAAIQMLAPVPLALSLYLAFSLLRYWLITKRAVPGWFVAISVCADVGLVLGLIWSFHIQYGQPPGFALKAPTFVYLIVLVVLRALRFDPRYVLAVGLAGAAGWAALTFAAIVAAGDGAVTHSFVDYLTSSRILIGAEFDKIFAMLIITGVLTLSARRAERTLASAVREESAAREIGRFLSKGVAEQISRSGTLIEAGEAVERNAAILMLDIRGFTPFATRVPAKEVVRVLTAFHARIIPVVRANGGVIDKFLGDGVMATFGGTEVSETAAANALRALEQVLVEAQAWQKALPEIGVSECLTVNAAVASGPIVFATLGGGDRLEYTVIGEAVNLAAKLEKHNKTEGTRALFPAVTLAQATAQGYKPTMPSFARPGCKVAGVPGAIDLQAF
jgi:adenylate cyclase